MDFRFTDEQRELANLCAQIAEIGAPKSVDGDAEALDLAPLVDTGLLSLLVPESRGGGGASLVEGAILAEQLGRYLAPSVVVTSALLVPAALDLVQSAALRDGLTDELLSGRPGSIVVRNDLSWPPGEDNLVYGWHADAFVLAPQSGGLGPWSGGALTAHPTEDPGLLVAPISTPALATEVVRSPAAQRFVATANVLISSVLLGHMEAVLDRAVAYANGREQFGVKIGSFQAIKHLCADMFVDVEGSRSAVFGAAAIAASTDELDEASRAAAVAKAWCGDAAIRVCEGSIQVHGGIGFTWECDVHRYLRAAHVLRASFMTVDDALDLVGGVDHGPS